MNTTFQHLILKDELSQSAALGEFYLELFEQKDSFSFTSPLIEDVDELKNSILMTYDDLTDFQKKMLQHIFEEFNTIREKIDPRRLKAFSHYFNNDGELLLYRETENGLTNIILNPEECIAFSFIPNNEGKRILYFVNEDGDFEALAYSFFAN